MSLNENNVKKNKAGIKVHGRACQHCDYYISVVYLDKLQTDFKSNHSSCQNINGYKTSFKLNMLMSDLLT